MRIAVIHHSNDFSNDYAAYLSALLDETAVENNYVVKDYHRLLFDKEVLTGENIVLHIVINAENSFAIRYWYGLKLPSIFKKCAIEKVICQYGILTSSRIAQILVLPDTALLSPNKKMLPWQKIAAKNVKKNIAAAQTVITYSQHAKNETEELNGNNAKKIAVFPYTANLLFKPLEWHDKLYIKSRFAENKEFFAAVLPHDDEKVFTELLKAFSKFKKWQQSSMQLLLLPKEDAFAETIHEKLETYKYRQDVKLVNDADKKEIADIFAAAYALIHVSPQDADLLPVAAALQSATPVIAFSTESLQEYCGNAVILITEPGYELLGDQLTQLYKNETQRAEMSEAAIKRTEIFQQKEHAEKLWQLLNEKL